MDTNSDSFQPCGSTESVSNRFIQSFNEHNEKTERDVESFKMRIKILCYLYRGNLKTNEEK